VRCLVDDSSVAQGQALCAYKIHLFSSSQPRSAIVSASARSGYRWGATTRKRTQINHAKISQSSVRNPQSPFTFLLLKVANSPSLLLLSLLKIATILAAIFIACASPRPCAAFRGGLSSPSSTPAATSITPSATSPISPSLTDAAGCVPVKGGALIICMVLSSYAMGQGISILSTRNRNKRRASGEMSSLRRFCDSG
jgi:hypothetical protein